MMLRPTRHALIEVALRGTVMAVPGLLLIYAAWSSRVILPAIFGAPLVILGVVILVNSSLARLQLDSGVLQARSLLSRSHVRVDQITKIVPINLSYRRTIYTLWNRSAAMFEVWTEKGPAPFWLNPNVYGQQAIQDLIRELRIEPETAVRERVLEPFSLNRTMGTTPDGDSQR